MVLPRNIRITAGLLTALEYEKTDDGDMGEAHAIKLAAVAKGLVEPFPFSSMDLPAVPTEYWEIIKRLVVVSDSVAVMKTYWSREYLVAYREPSMAKLRIDALAKHLLKKHAEAMRFIILDSGMNAFSRIWSKDNIEELRNTVDNDKDTFQILHGLWSQL